MACSNTRRTLIGLVAAAALSIGAALPAQAALLNFEFVATTLSGTLDLGSGPVDVAGTPVTVSGMTVFETDLAAITGVGIFNAITTFDFGGLGSFVADFGTTFYFQDCVSPTAFDCIGILYNIPAFVSGFGIFVPVVAADPNIATAIGSPVPSPGFGEASGTLSNTLGHSLTGILVSGDSVTSVSVTAKVAEPMTLSLVGAALLGLGLAARNRRHA